MPHQSHFGYMVVFWALQIQSSENKVSILKFLRKIIYKTKNVISYLSNQLLRGLFTETKISYVPHNIVTTLNI